jgi:hypothetical protein
MVFEGTHRGDDGVERAATAAQDPRTGLHRGQHPAPAIRALCGRTATARATVRHQRRSYVRMLHVIRPGGGPR